MPTALQKTERNEKKAERNEKKAERNEKKAERNEKKAERNEKKAERNEKKAERNEKKAERNKKKDCTGFCFLLQDFLFFCFFFEACSLSARSLIFCYVNVNFLACKRSINRKANSGKI